MEFLIDPDVKAVAEFMQTNIAASRLMTELTVVEAPKPKLTFAGGGPGTPITPEGGKTPPDINILMAGQRLQITADVDLEGVAKLREALGKYEELLKMLQ